MKRRNISLPRPSFLGALALASIARGVLGLEQIYCSNQNTGADDFQDTDTYQSNGACYKSCAASYAFAIVQWQSCWCSNYIPATQDDTSECDEQCPGYPDDNCGSQDKNLFGYIKLPNEPSGTAGASPSSETSSTSIPPTTSSSVSSSTSSTEPPQTSYVSQTVFQTVTPDPSTSVRVSYVTPTTPTLTTTSSSTTSTTPTSTSTTTPTSTSTSTSTSPSTSPPGRSSTPSPVTSIQVVTVSGAPVTHTVTSTPWVASSPDANQIPIQRKDLSGGAIAGIVIGILAAVAALLVGAFFLWRRKRQSDSSDGQTGAKAKSPQRTTSVLSKTGLLARSGTTKRDMRENTWDEPLFVNSGTGNTSRASAFYGLGALSGQGVSPSSPLDSRSDGTGRRNSKPLVYDQRLNPSALWAHQDANSSRISMQDNADFSRPLAVTNPDPRASFDSRLSHAG